MTNEGTPQNFFKGPIYPNNQEISYNLGHVWD